VIVALVVAVRVMIAVVVFAVLGGISISSLEGLDNYALEDGRRKRTSRCGGDLACVDVRYSIGLGRDSRFGGDGVCEYSADRRG